MLTRILNLLKGAARRPYVAPVLHSLGIMRLGRSVYHRHLLRRGTHEVTVRGERLRFAVGSIRAIERIEYVVPSEGPLIERMLGAIRPHDVFYDIGANIGLFTLLVMSRHRGHKITVHAIEPEPRAADVLRKNLKLNSLEDVMVHETALGSSTGMTEFFVDPDPGSGKHSLFSILGADYYRIEIQMMTGADFMRDTRSTPDVLKIDVEGAEMEVLRGFQKALESGRVRELFIEVHTQALLRYGSSHEALRGWLQDRGYAPAWSHKRGHEFHEHYCRS